MRERLIFLFSDITDESGPGPRVGVRVSIPITVPAAKKA